MCVCGYVCFKEMFNYSEQENMRTPTTVSEGKTKMYCGDRTEGPWTLKHIHRGRTGEKVGGRG